MIVATQGCSGGAGHSYWASHEELLTYDTTQSVAENFLEADPPEDEDGSSSWLSTYDQRSYDPVIQTYLDGDEGWIVFNDQVFPGRQDGELWVFSDTRTYSSSWDYSDPAEPGYVYKYIVERTYDYLFELTLGETLEGTLDERITVAEFYRESDEWDSEDIGPSSSALGVYDVYDEDGEPAENNPLGNDCEGEYCDYGDQTQYDYSYEYTGELL